MMLLLLLLSICPSLAHNSRSEERRNERITEGIKEWEQYKTEHDKVYENFEEESKAIEIFFKNAKYMKKHADSFAFLHTFNKSEVAHNRSIAVIDSSRLDGVDITRLLKKHHGDLPASVDWRVHNRVTAVKDQRRIICASCYAFASVGALEGQWSKKGPLMDLSAQQIVDCTYSGTSKYGNHGCDGGHIDISYKYLIDQGSMSETSYPYKAKLSRCLYDSAKVEVRPYGFMHNAPEFAVLEAAVAYQGPIAAGMNANVLSFQKYTGGVYKDEDCVSSARNHAVVVVGYGTDEADGDYWIIKNSYGSRWGEDGYIRLKKDSTNLCGLYSETFYPFVE